MLCNLYNYVAIVCIKWRRYDHVRRWKSAAESTRSLIFHSSQYR